VKTAEGSQELPSGGEWDGRFGESQLAGRNRRDGSEFASVGTLSLWTLGLPCVRGPEERQDGNGRGDTVRLPEEGKTLKGGNPTGACGMK
jgi:hypothetical protein